MSDRLTKDFYLQPATVLAAKLLGKYLVRKTDEGEIIRARITETECYFGEEDTACHASRGLTKRTSVMYREGGVAYIYLCYGIHSLLNIVSGTEGHPEAVLIRAVDGYVGPGKLTKMLKIKGDLNGENLITSEKLWLEDGENVEEYASSPRIGIDYAEEADRLRLWRYTVK